MNRWRRGRMEAVVSSCVVNTGCTLRPVVKHTVLAMLASVILISQHDHSRRVFASAAAARAFLFVSNLLS